MNARPNEPGDPGDPVAELRDTLNEVAGQTEPLETIRQNYIKCNTAEPAEAIKTPSVVLSWDSRNTETITGGHKLDSRALRFEPSSDVSSMALARDRDGRPVLRYNPSRSQAVEENASEI